MARFLKISLALLALAAGFAGSAQAAVVSGSNLAAAPNNVTCIVPAPGLEQPCTVTVAGLPAASQAPGGTTAAISGVIVNWKVRIGASVGTHPVRLRVLRGNTAVGSGPVETLPATAGIHSFAARVPVQAGDVIGFDQLEPKYLAGVQYIRTTAPGAQMGFWIPALGEGETRDPFALGSDIELLMNATIEPDADNDGYGDETQDKCPSSAATAGTCLPPAPIPTEAVPNTKVSKVRVDGAKASFRFTSTVKGSKFKCKLDKKRWKSCKSPKVYRGLNEGRHSFQVKAIGPTAVPDPTPAKRSFRVEL